MEPSKEIKNCTVNFQCPKLWDRLATTDDPKVRFCDECSEKVYLAQNEEELAEQAARGRCVAILNLSPEHQAYNGEALLGDIDPDWSTFDKPKKE